jgi:ABC-2 type transport system permease protein
VTTSIEHANPVAIFPNATAPASGTSLRALPSQSMLFARRVLRSWSRDPWFMVQTLIYPMIMLVMFRVVLGDSVTMYNSIPLINGGVEYEKPDAIYGTLPMMVLVSAMFGSVTGAVTLTQERESGLLGRFWVLPVHRGADLLGRFIAEFVRVLATTGVLLAVGVCLGFRFNQGPIAALALVAVPLYFGVAFGIMVTAFALISRRRTLVEIVALVVSLLMFFNAGFVPVSAYPVWIQPIVEYQPMTPTIEAMRALAIGGNVAGPLTQTLIWATAMLVLFIYPALKGYRMSVTRF